VTKERAQPKTGSNPLREALTPQQLQNLAPTQRKVLLDGIARHVDKHGKENVTPAMIQGQYELVTEHLLPGDLEELEGLRGWKYGYLD